jgi:hypothetical protein
MANRNRPLVVIIDGEPYYSAQKAEEVLGMTYSALRNQVIAGNISAKTPRGRRQLHYRAKDVDQLAREINIYTVQRQHKPSEFKRVETRKEMEKCQEISQAIFNMGPETVDDRMQIIAKNPNTYFMLTNEGQIVGYAAIIPLKLGKLNKVLGETIPVDIPIEYISDFKQEKEIDLYFRVIAIRPGLTIGEKRLYASRLIAELINVIIDFGRKGIKIKTAAARSNTPDGIRLLRGIGFTEIKPLTPDRRTFIINIKESGIPFILQYKEALQEAETRQNATPQLS